MSSSSLHPSFIAFIHLLHDRWLTSPANARTIYGPTRHLDIISFAPSSGRKSAAAIVEHRPAGDSYIHCCSSQESSRLAAVEQLLVLTEEMLQGLIEAGGITHSGWLPAAQMQEVGMYETASWGRSSVPASLLGSVRDSMDGSIDLPE